MVPFHLLNVMLALPALTMLALAPRPAIRLPDDRQHLYQWFDSLGYPTAFDSPFVRVDGWWQNGDKRQPTTPEYGFLLQSARGRFEILTLDLDRVRYPSAYDHATYSTLDFPKWAATALARFRHYEGYDLNVSWPYHGRLSARAQMFFLSRICAAHGLDRLAAAFYDAADRQTEVRRDGTLTPLSETLATDLAGADIWRVQRDFGNPAVSREDLLTHLQAYVRNFPSGKDVPSAREAVDILATMVREDREHAAMHRSALDQLPVDERAAELIFQLRDQNGYQISTPGSIDPFADPRGEQSPAARLARMGYSAVPQLIEAVADRRFTRCVGLMWVWSGFSFTHNVLRVGDVALQVLQKIAGRGFYESPTGRTADDDDTMRAGIQSSARRWWDDVQHRGEFAVLDAGVRLGDGNAVGQAEKMAQKYSERALPAIAVGIHTTKENWVRAGLVSTAARLKGAATTQLLQEQLDHGADLRSRVVAAWGLLRSEPNVAVEAMIREWRRLPVKGEDDWSIGALMDFLASSGDPRAIDAFGTALERQDIGRQLAVVSRFTQGGLPPNSFSPASSREIMPVTRPAKPAYAHAVERLLTGELADTERLDETSTPTTYSFDDRRICDAAAAALAANWPKKYRFAPVPSPGAREAMRIGCLNAWRVSQGLRPVTQPYRAVVRRLPSDPARARRLACTVRAIRIVGEPGNGAVGLVRRARALRDLPLTTDAVLGLLYATTICPTTHPIHLRFLAERDDNGAGISLTLDFRAPMELDYQYGWVTSEHVSVGGANTLLSGGNGLQPFGAFNNLGTAVHKALNTPPRTVLYVAVSLHHWHSDAQK